LPCDATEPCSPFQPFPSSCLSPIAISRNQLCCCSLWQTVPTAGVEHTTFVCEASDVATNADYADYADCGRWGSRRRPLKESPTGGGGIEDHLSVKWAPGRCPGNGDRDRAAGGQAARGGDPPQQHPLRRPRPLPTGIEPTSPSGPGTGTEPAHPTNTKTWLGFNAETPTHPPTPTPPHPCGWRSGGVAPASWGRGCCGSVGSASTPAPSSLRTRTPVAQGRRGCHCPRGLLHRARHMTPKSGASIPAAFKIYKSEQPFEFAIKT